MAGFQPFFFCTIGIRGRHDVINSPAAARCTMLPLASTSSATVAWRVEMGVEYQMLYNETSSAKYRERLRQSYPEFTERHVDGLVDAFEREMQREIDKLAQRPQLYLAK
jgi:hypothetical protein